jgi:Protein of unknown function (DUF1153)
MKAGAAVMQNQRHAPAKGVFGPNGTRLTLGNLPCPDSVRWVASRKAELIAAVRGGLLTLDEACKRYGITPEEYLNWRDSMARFGMAGLHATNVQMHRWRAK